jgi:DNA-binding transcriptional LysR family regulator
MRSPQYPASESGQVPFPGRPAWPGIELRHLIALQAVVSAGSFNGAAARLGYSQSAVSAQIGALERLVGVRVLDRSRGARSIRLTREGQILLRYATEIVGRFEAAAAHLLGGKAASPGELRIGSFRSASLAFVAPALARMPDDVRVSLVEHDDEGPLLDLLADGELDLTFATAPVRSGFGTTMLHHESYVAVMERCDRSELAVAELADRRVIVGSTAHGAMLAQAALAAGAAATTVVEDETTAAALATAGVGVALLPELSCLPSRDAAIVRLRGDLPLRTIVLAWSDDRPRTDSALQFIRAVTAIAHAARARAA